MGYGLLVIRLIVGLTFAGHGTQKLFGWFGGYGIKGTGGWLESISVKPGILMALLAGLAELIGGLLFAAGMWLPVAAALLVINAIYRKAFVVHICDESNIEAVNQTAARLPADVSEVETVGLTPVQSTVIDVPGVKQSKIRMECVLDKGIPLGADNASCDLLIGRIVHFHIEEELYQNGRIDPLKLKPVSRLAGNNYATLGRIVEIERPN